MATTVNVVAPLTEPEAAVIVVWPTATAIAVPEPAIVATLVAEEFHVTLEAMFCVLPSL